MTKNDALLFEFFRDLDGILNYKNDYQSLYKLYNSAVSIINKKKYSNINIQEQSGNTFLHYAGMSKNLSWSVELLKLGADPMIQNKEGLNFWALPKNYGFNHQIYKHFSSIKIDQSFPQCTKNLALSFKESLLRSNENKIHIYKNLHSIDEMLQEAKIFTQDNRLQLLLSSVELKMNPSQLIKDYISNFSTPEQNSLFLTSLYDYRHVKSEMVNELKKTNFFEREFALDTNFLNSLRHLVEKNPKDFAKKNIALTIQENLNYFINIIVRQKMDIRQEINSMSIENILTSNSYFSAQYNKILLEKNIDTPLSHKKLSYKL